MGVLIFCKHFLNRHLYVRLMMYNVIKEQKQGDNNGK